VALEELVEEIPGPRPGGEVVEGHRARGCITKQLVGPAGDKIL
jgi:hypothetical protein